MIKLALKQQNQQVLQVLKVVTAQVQLLYRNTVLVKRLILEFLKASMLVFKISISYELKFPSLNMVNITECYSCPSKKLQNSESN